MTRTAPARRTVVALAGAALGTGLLIAAAPTASAAPALVDREAEGTCSAGSRWNLEVETEHRGLKADFDLDTSASGQTWKLRLKHKGKLVAKVNRVTDRDGEIDYQRMLPNRPGTDKVVVKAKNRVTGEKCKAVVRI